MPALMEGAYIWQSCSTSVVMIEKLNSTPDTCKTALYAAEIDARRERSAARQAAG